MVREVAGIRRLFEAILVLGSARGVGLIVTLVRQKVLAIVLGPSGVGVLGLLRTFLDPLTQVLPLGINAGVVKFVARYRGEGDDRALRSTISTAGWFFLTVSSAAALVVLLLSKPLAVAVLGHEVYTHLIVLAALSLPCTILAGYFNALLVGAQRVATIARIHYLGHAVTLVVTIPLIVVLEITGAVAGIVLLELFYCVAFRVAAARYVPVNLRSFAASRLLRLSSYGAATLADTGLWMLALFVARVDYTRRFEAFGAPAGTGDVVQGFFETIFRLSFTYLAVLIFAINTYLFPRMAALESDRDVPGELNTALRGLWLMLVPIAMVLSVSIKPLIWLFRTGQFYPSEVFLPWQLVGDVFYMTWYVLGLALLGRGRLGAYVGAGVVRSVVFLGVYYLAWRVVAPFPADGLKNPQTFQAVAGWPALVWAYAASGVVTAVLAYFALNRLYGFALSRDNAVLIGLSSLAILPVLFVPNRGPVWVGAKLAALLVWLPLVVRAAEWRKGLGWLGELTARK